MKKVLFFSLMLLALVGCKKEESKTDPVDTTTDPRDAFVGTYDLTIDFTFNADEKTGIEAIDNLLSGSYQYNEVMTISKDESDDAKVIVKSGLYYSSALVSGNKLIIESENVSDKQYRFGATSVTFNYTVEHGTAELNDNVLVWHSDATGTATVSAVTVNGSASLDNTATKQAK